MYNPLIRMQSAYRTIFIAVMLLNLYACQSIVRPNFTTDLKTLRAGQYELDTRHSFLNFMVDHLGLSKIVGRFNEFDASLDFDPANPAALKLSGLISADSIDLNNPDLEETLQDDAWFNSALHPQISFESNQVSSVEESTLMIEGILSIRGTEQPVTVVATFNGGADNLLTRRYTIGFSAQTRIARSSFGMDAFSEFIGDDIEIELHGEFLRR